MVAARAPRASFLVLTEDGGAQAHATVEALAKKLLRLVDPHCQTQKLAFEPAEDHVARVACANRWKSTAGRDREAVVRLRRAIATKVAEDRGFVLFHVDGDCRFSERESSENLRKFPKLVTNKVAEVLRHGRPDWSEEEIARRVSRLLVLTPCYSVEAWTYQNIDAAVELCSKHHGGRDVDQFEAWRAARALIDEHDRPKDTICLGGRHNRELASRAFPAAEAYAARTSFALAADSLRACDELRATLEATYAANDDAD